MGAYHHASTTFRRRMAITVDNSAGAAATELDVDTTIPKDHPDFWSVIDSAGNNIRVTAADGVTDLVYALDDGAGGAFDATNRKGRIRIDGMPIPTGTAGVFLAWVYYAPDADVSSGASVVSISGAVSGYIEIGEPTGPWWTTYQPQILRSTNPRDARHKGPGEQVYIWFRMDSALERYARERDGSRVREEPYYASMAVLDTSASDVTSMYDLASCRFLWHQATRSIWLKVLVKGGTTDTRYTAAPTVRTCLPYAPTTVHKSHTPRMGLAVRQVIFES